MEFIRILACNLLGQKVRGLVALMTPSNDSSLGVRF